MSEKSNAPNIVSGLLGGVVFTIGLLNLVLVHSVPGIIGILLSVLYLPQTNDFLQKKFGFSIPPVAKILLGLFVIWFTLGVSDLGDMIDDGFMSSNSHND